MDEMEEQVIPLLIILGIGIIFIALLLVLVLYALYSYFKKRIKRGKDDEVS